MREGYKAGGLAISNRLRGLLAEFGVVVARSDVALRRALADDAIRGQLPAMLRGLLDDLQQHWQQVRERVAAATLASPRTPKPIFAACVHSSCSAWDR